MYKRKLKRLNKLVCLLLLFLTSCTHQYFGSFSDFRGLPKQATVHVYSTNKIVKSDKYGRFNFRATKDSTQVKILLDSIGFMRTIPSKKGNHFIIQ